MTPLNIKIELMKANITQASIARKFGVQPTSVLRVIENRSASARIQHFIADAIGRDIKDLWPNAGRKPGRPKTSLDNQATYKPI